MAIMLEQLDLQAGQRVLEIGAGSGFNAALIASIVGPDGAVVTVDIQPDLVEGAREALDRAGYGWVQAVAGDGAYGCPEGAPYDRIILSVASSVIAPAWMEQLAPDGRLVLPLALPGGQKSAAFQRQGQELVSVSAKGCGFMALQGDLAPSPGSRVQVGSDPNLFLSFGDEFLSFWDEGELPVMTDRFAGWLSEPGQDWATGITTRMGELGSSFFPWLGLQGLQGEERRLLHAGLTAKGDLADRDDIPAGFGLGGEGKSTNTAVLIEADGAAAMMRPPGQRPPLADVNSPWDRAPFEVYVRQLGPGSYAAQSMVRSVQDWDRAGRPKSRWQIRALPAEMAYISAEGEYVLDYGGAKLIIRYL